MAKARRLHYVITLQWTEATKVDAADLPGSPKITISSPTRYFTTDGIVKPGKGTTRQKIFLDVFAHTVKQAAIAEGTQVGVIHWSLEDNEIL